MFQQIKTQFARKKNGNDNDIERAKNVDVNDFNVHLLLLSYQSATYLIDSLRKLTRRLDFRL